MPVETVPATQLMEYNLVSAAVLGVSIDTICRNWMLPDPSRVNTTDLDILSFLGGTALCFYQVCFRHPRPGPT